jgi:acid stress-induced BolA-like protein IbaG/YrbA
MEDTRFLEDKKGFRVGTMYDVPALKLEPYMPPDAEVRRWVYLRYVGFGTFFQWSLTSLGWTEELKKRSKPNKEVKAKAAELIAGAQTDEEKLKNIYEFVQKNIKNVHFDDTYDAEQIKKLDVKDADDALKKGMGGSYAIDMLFASLARVAGFETNVILAGDREDFFFSPGRYPFPNFIQMHGVAVKIGNTWRYFDPCTPYHPFGQLEWRQENMDAMLIGDGGFVWKKIPVADQAVSSAKRTAKLNLSADGTLEGTVRIEYNGHLSLTRRRDYFRVSQVKREEKIKDDIKERLSNAEITNLTIENFDDNSKPLAYSYSIKVPNYSQRAGKRLILRPGFFEYGTSPVFSAATRTHDISFPFPWSENDEIDIQLPKDFELDAADAPAELFDPRHIGGLKITMNINRTTNVLKYTRKFHFGAFGAILFPPAAYAPLKNLFDSFYKADTHAVSIKQSVR